MLINNPHETRCSIEGCNSIYIARKKDWICGVHLQMEYNKKSIRGLKSWNKGNKKPIRKISAKRQIENKIYTRTRKEFLSLPENKYCKIFKNRLSTEIHHKKTRIGSLFLEQKYWMSVSREGHNHIHDNTKWSYDNGYLISKYQ